MSQILKRIGKVILVGVGAPVVLCVTIVNHMTIVLLSLSVGVVAKTIEYIVYGHFDTFNEFYKKLDNVLSKNENLIDRFLQWVHEL